LRAGSAHGPEARAPSLEQAGLTARGARPSRVRRAAPYGRGQEQLGHCHRSFDLGRHRRAEDQRAVSEARLERGRRPQSASVGSADLLAGVASGALTASPCGTEATTRVPCPGRLEISNDPPRAAIRSFMFESPRPTRTSPLTGIPRPWSATSSLRSLPCRRTATWILSAAPCFCALTIASSATKYSAVSASRLKRRPTT